MPVSHVLFTLKKALNCHFSQYKSLGVIVFLWQSQGFSHVLQSRERDGEARLNYFCMKTDFTTQQISNTHITEN